MIDILPALPVEAKPVDPKDRFIDLVAMKEYAAWVGFPDGLDFWTRHDMAVAWAEQRDYRYDRRAWDEVQG